MTESARTTMGSIARFLDDSAERVPGKIALVDGDRRIHYQALAELVHRLAHGLLGLGLARHDRVALYLDKTIETVATIFAATAAGLIVVPINTKLKPHQVQHILADSGAAALVTTAYRLRQLATQIELGTLQVVLTGKSERDTNRSDMVHAWDALVAPPDPSARLHRFIDVDPAAILYTSGSTGAPKGVVLSHRNLVCGATAVNAYLGTSGEDSILSLLPLSFDAGLSQLTTAAAVGAKVVLCNYVQPQDATKACAAEAVTSITGVPPLWAQLAAAPWDDAARSSVRLFANTGGHMPAPLLAQLRSLFPQAKPVLMYGLTEAFRSTYLDPAEVDRRPGSIGKAIPNAEILVLREDGSPCPPGESGELVHRGALVTLGYWNDPIRTAERFRALPMRPAGGLTPEFAVWSGDIVKTDDEGFLYFVGRRDEMIKSSGYRISPTEVETVLAEAPSVREAAVFGLPDEMLGQRVIAIVAPTVPPLAVERVLDHCRRWLPSYMVPHIIAIDALPRSPNGKIDRTALKHFAGSEMPNVCTR